MPRDQQPKPRGHPYQPLSVQTSHQTHSGATHQGRHRQPHPHPQHRDSRQESSQQHHRQVRPLYNQATVSQAEVRDSRAENLYRDRVCELCSEPDHEMFQCQLSEYQRVCQQISGWLPFQCEDRSVTKCSLVGVILIATTLPGPGQHYKLYMCFCYFHAKACLGMGN